MRWLLVQPKIKTLEPASRQNARMTPTLLRSSDTTCEVGLFPIRKNTTLGGAPKSTLRWRKSESFETIQKDS